MKIQIPSTRLSKFGSEGSVENGIAWLFYFAEDPCPVSRIGCVPCLPDGPRCEIQI